MENIKFFFRFETTKESMYKQCYKLQLTLEESHLIYKYYEENKQEFSINSKTSFYIDRIVEIIILKLNILVP